MLKRILLICLVCSCTLTGCVPALVVGGAAVGGAIIYDNRTFKQMNIDDHIARAAKAILNSDQTLKSQAHIVVSVYDGVLLIAGEAPTVQLRHQAYNLVSHIPNVKRIYNEITIQAPTSNKRRFKDSWITTKVKSALLAKDGFKSTNIKVMTENGVVFLLGDVTHHQADVATNIARRISGVKKVVKVFAYLQ